MQQARVRRDSLRIQDSKLFVDDIDIHAEMECNGELDVRSSFRKALDVLLQFFIPTRTREDFGEETLLGVGVTGIRTIQNIGLDPVDMDLQSFLDRFPIFTDPLALFDVLQPTLQSACVR